ncbi:MAG: MmgE/PrpD family protein [Betaproteobacteria bacterium]|nr:MmgE/PrpD family protein [Betaproteobacteria bacterium]
MGLSIEKLAQFTAQTQWEQIPAHVQQHAKLVLLDTLGVILAGSVRPEVAALRERMACTVGPGATVYALGASTHDPRTAALLNGIAGRAIELCEGLRLASGQAAMQILPGMLAVGEHGNVSGKTLLTALVTGYEIAARIGMAFTPRPLAHQNGQAMVIAAAAAGARMRGLDAAGVSLAMRISAILMMTPSYTNTGAGATALNVSGGMAGFAGAFAPDLALAGFEAQPDAIEESLSKMVGDGFNTEHLLDELGTRWEITRNYFRLHACCNPVHPAIDALQAALAELKPHAEDIERIEFATYRFASVMKNPSPSNYFASKYSLPHAAAVMVVRGDTRHRAIDDSALRDPTIAAVRARVSMVEDAAMSARVPKDKPAKVTLTLKDGRCITHAVDSHVGDFNNPYPEAVLREKFRDLASDVLTREGIAAVERAIDGCELSASVGELSVLIQRFKKH